LFWFVDFLLLLWFSLYVASCSDLSVFDCPFGFLSMLPERGNQKWTNKSKWQHSEKTKGAIKNGKTRAIGIIERKPKEQSKMDKPEQLAT
jgi:hypothetical protein